MCEGCFLQLETYCTTAGWDFVWLVIFPVSLASTIDYTSLVNDIGTLYAEFEVLLACLVKCAFPANTSSSCCRTLQSSICTLTRSIDGWLAVWQTRTPLSIASGRSVSLFHAAEIVLWLASVLFWIHECFQRRFSFFFHLHVTCTLQYHSCLTLAIPCALNSQGVRVQCMR